MNLEMERDKKRMDAKEYLEQARDINIFIENKLEQVTSLRNLATKVNSALSPVPPSGNSRGDRLENIISEMVDLEKEIDEDVDRLVALKRNILKAINRIEDSKERMVLEMRYLNFKDWPDIADKTGVRLRRVYQIHRDALEHIELPDEIIS